jgi:hypothetical protein
MSKRSKQQTTEQVIYEATHAMIAAPFNGAVVMVRLRELSQLQVAAIGDISMIETFFDKVRARNQKPTTQEMSAYGERMHQICREAMAIPTYDEMMKIVGAHIDDEATDRELREIKELWLSLPRGTQEWKDLKRRYEAVEIARRFILPADFTAFVVDYSLGISKTDIKKVTEKILIDAYYSAKRGGGAPSDYVSGNFERWPGDMLHKNDVNNRAYYLGDLDYDMRRRKQRA